MDLRILGPLEAYDGEGRAIELGGRQQRLVLATLLLHRNEVVSVDRLIDTVWGERPPANAAKNIQVHISRLRKALQADSLGEDGGSLTSPVRTRAGGYVLEIAPGDLDVDRFQRLVDTGRRALAAREFEQAAVTLRDALALWCGRPLADFAYDSFAQSEIGRLDELRLGALEDRIDADLALGREDDVTAELQGLVAEHPLRERLRGHLMLALYRSGRKAEALRVYDEARRALAEELGLEPSASLQDLQRAVLSDDPSLAAPATTPKSRPARVAAEPARTDRLWVLLGVGGALLLAAALAVAGLAATRDRTTAGIVSVGPNSLAAIDPNTNRVVAEIPVGARPASVLSAHGALWVANLDDDTVSRIDPKAKRVVRTIPTATDPSGLAGGAGAVWAIGSDGVVLRIDPAFNEVVERIETVDPGGPIGAPASGAVVATPDAVWAVSGGLFSTPRLFRVNPATNRVAQALTIGTAPTALAVGFGDLWVTDGFENTLSRIDPSGATIATTPLGYGASAVAVGEGAIWVVESVDDTIVRVDPATNSVTTTIAVGRYPSGIAVGAGAVWVANRHDGTVSRIDPSTNVVVEVIEVGAGLAGIVVADGLVWMTGQSGASSPPSDAATTSDIARFNAGADYETDPARYADFQINYATCAKLLNYPDATGPAGTRLVPEVAAALPVRSADGRTYTFTIRDGFAFSPPLHERVTSETFKYAIERSLHPKMGGFARTVMNDIVGQSAYEAGKSPHLSGVVAKGDNLSITLVRPAPDFLARIASPFFCAVPLNTPIDPEGVREIPSAGPYYIAEHEPNQRMVLARNPNYEGSRPQRLREMHYTIGVTPAQSVADVEAGRSDYLADGSLPDDREAEAALAARYGPASAAARNGAQQYFVTPTLALAYLALNTSRPLFSNARVRSAVNYAIDRRELARHGNFRITGYFPAIPTDQYLPPTMPGAGGTSLYPPSGDLRTARRLAPDVRGMPVLYTCNLPYCRRHAQVIKSNLAALGLGVDVRHFPLSELIERATTKGEPFDIITTHWAADYADPSTFLNVLLDQRIRSRGNTNFSYLTSRQLASRLEHVARLTGEARYRGYAALSVQLARVDVPWVVYGTGTARHFFSARIGCQLFHPVYVIDLAALCIRR